MRKAFNFRRKEMIAWIVAGVVVVLFYGIYVSLIKKRNNVKESASSIDVHLKLRYDLIPNMLKAAAKYMEHEKDVFMQVTELREKALNAENYADKFEADKALTGAMRTFNLKAENYPELKSDTVMLAAQRSMAEVEEHISAARRFYNSAVKDYKNGLEIFPSSLIAKMIGLKDVYPFFEVEEAAKERIDVNSFFN